MKKFNIVVTWYESAVCEVSANSLEEAKKLVRNSPEKYVPEHGEYIGDSMIIDDDATEDYNE
jgi:hypothetical protein